MELQTFTLSLTFDYTAVNLGTYTLWVGAKKAYTYIAVYYVF